MSCSAYFCSIPRQREFLVTWMHVTIHAPLINGHLSFNASSFSKLMVTTKGCMLCNDLSEVQ